eukprot:8323242-Pyramimonas_sp.AAC.1
MNSVASPSIAPSAGGAGPAVPACAPQIGESRVRAPNGGGRVRARSARGAGCGEAGPGALPPRPGAAAVPALPAGRAGEPGAEAGEA